MPPWKRHLGSGRCYRAGRVAVVLGMKRIPFPKDPGQARGIRGFFGLCNRQNPAWEAGSVRAGALSHPGDRRFEPDQRQAAARKPSPFARRFGRQGGHHLPNRGPSSANLRSSTWLPWCRKRANVLLCRHFVRFRHVRSHDRKSWCPRSSQRGGGDRDSAEAEPQLRAAAGVDGARDKAAARARFAGRCA
jgi:hypothetical protein